MNTNINKIKDTVVELNYRVKNDYGLEIIEKEFKEIKKFDKIFLSFIKEGAKFFNTIGSGEEGIIIEIINEEKSKNYIGKFAKEKNNHLKNEYINHLIFLHIWYEGLKDKTYKKYFDNIIIPFINTKYSEPEKCLVIDYIPGYTIKHHMIRHIFSPLFNDKEAIEDLGRIDENNKYITNDKTIEDDLKNIISKEIKTQITSKESIINKKYINHSLEKLLDMIGLRGDRSIDNEELIKDVFGNEKGEKINIILDAFNKYYKKFGVEHADLHAGNVIINEENGILKVGIIDFGRTRIENKLKLLEYFNIII